MLDDTDQNPVLQLLGSNVKTFRHLKGLTQRALAERVVKSPATICKIESGKSWVSDEFLYDLAYALDVDIEDLFVKSSSIRPRKSKRISLNQSLEVLANNWQNVVIKRRPVSKKI